tara:strand:- start:102 stop:323 length:222 start_codon:yes stop_codon:yes gene_type:complete
MLEFYILLAFCFSLGVCIYVVSVVSKETGEEKAERKFAEAEFKATQTARKEAARIKAEVAKLSDAELDKYLDK